MKFKAKDKILTVKSSCYYVPKAEGRFLSPQRLFNAVKGVTRKSIVKEKHATLSFDNLGDIQIEYDSCNSLLTPLGKNKVLGVAEVNLG